MLYQGKGTDPTNGDGYSLVALFKKWRSQKSRKTMVVEVPHGSVVEFNAFLAKIQGKIVG